jgi:hypothetical protein
MFYCEGCSLCPDPVYFGRLAADVTVASKDRYAIHDSTRQDDIYGTDFFNV